MLRQLRHIAPVYWLAVIVTAIGAWPLITGEFLPTTSDGIFHTHRIFAMTELMRNGDLYPRWVPWFHLGYGYPVFNYYAPLGTWLGGVLGLAGISAALSFQLLTATCWILGSLGMTALGRRFFPDAVALAGAALWVYAPARLHEYWIQGSIAHVLATALLPWVFWGIVAVIERPTRRLAVGLGVAVGLLILSHQPTTYLMALYAVPMGVTLLAAKLMTHQKEMRLSACLRVARAGMLSAVIALGLAAVLLLPLIFEVGYIVINDAPTQNIPMMLDMHTVPLSEQFRQPLAPDLTDFSTTIPHSYGILGLLGLLGFSGLWWRGRRGLALLLVTGVVVSVVLATPTARDVWTRFPLMEQLRFPWRVLRVGVVPVALLAAASVLCLPRRWQTAGGIALTAAAIVIALPIMHPLGRLVDFGEQNAADMLRYELQSGAVGGTSYNEFKPRWGEFIPVDAPRDLIVYENTPTRLSLSNTVGVQVTQVDDACWRINRTLSEAWVDVRQFYFPGWRATLDGVHIPVMPEARYGLLRALIPVGADTGVLCVAYIGTPLQRLAGWLTLITVVLSGGIWWQGRQSGLEQKIKPVMALHGRWVLILAVGLIGTAIVNGVWVGPRTTLFRVVSPVDAPAGMQTPARHNFQQGYDLLGYTLHTTRVEPGGWVEITLYWLPKDEPSAGRYRPVVQLVNLSGTDAWGSTELPYIGNNPYGHDSTRFISHRVRIAVFEDALPYVGQLHVRLYDNMRDDWVLSADDDAQHIALPDIIAVDDGEYVRLDESVPLIAEALALSQYSVQRMDDDTLAVIITWQIWGSLNQDPTLFIHALDDAGTIISQQDVPLFSSLYPARHWRRGQQITQTYTLSDSSEITQLAVGLYTSAGRLAVTHTNQPVPDNRILIEIAGR